MNQNHLEDAAGLVAGGYRALRRDVPVLPPRHEEKDSLLPLLRDLASQVPGVVAIRDGKLAGFLLAWLLPEFRGRPATYIPEWAHAADGQDSPAVYQAMYAHLSAQWVAEGYGSHLVTIMAHDRSAIEAWHWLGFGLVVADAVRDLEPADGPSAMVEIHRAGPREADTVMALDRALDEHLASAPVFRPPVPHSRGYFEEWLADAARPLWLAYLGGEPVAVMGAGPPPPDVCHMVSDPGTASILTAYTLEGVRERGVGTALLNHLLAWARITGHQRCAVDFETQNIPGARFWLGSFQPACYSLLRYVGGGAA